MRGYDNYAFEKLPKKEPPMFVAVGNSGRPGAPNAFSERYSDSWKAFEHAAQWRDEGFQAAVYREEETTFECIGPFDEQANICPFPHIRTANL